MKRFLLVWINACILAACQLAVEPVYSPTPVNVMPFPPTWTAAITPLPADTVPPIPTNAVSPTPAEQVGLTETASPTPAIEPLPSATPTCSPDDWQSLPVIPTLNEQALAIYRQGLALGNDPHAFSKVGDGEISTVWFLTNFDFGPSYYDLGPYTDLQPVIEYFAGSFGRSSQAARRGFNTTRILDPSFADRESCEPGESPLVCEIRLHRPSFAIISMGTNQVWQPEVFEPEMETIIETLIDWGVLPILATKADNLEGDGCINAIIARLADEHGLPVWNFWLAVQPLPDHGLQQDREHLTYAGNDFSDPEAMAKAWPVRNLTALQLLNALRLAVSP